MSEKVYKMISFQRKGEPFLRTSNWEYQYSVKVEGLDEEQPAMAVLAGLNGNAGAVSQVSADSIEGIKLDDESRGKLSDDSIRWFKETHNLL
jgi:hypothetical protein